MQKETLKLTLACTVLIVVAASASAVIPGTDVLIPAAARGQGSGDSLWITSLFLTNPGEQVVPVTVSFLYRNPQGDEPPYEVLNIEAGASLAYADVMAELFFIEAGGGALRVTAPEPIVVSGAILNRAGGQEFGQGFEGIPVEAATPAGLTSYMPGVAHNDAFRTNVYLIDATGAGAQATVEVLDLSGEVIGSKEYFLAPWEPVIENLDRIGSFDFSEGTLRLRVTGGKVIAGASRVNNQTGDPITFMGSTPIVSLEGYAPESIVGHRYAFVMAEPGGGDEWVQTDIVFDTESTGSFVDDDETYTFNYGEYRTIVNMAIMVIDVPSEDIENMDFVMVWTDEGVGLFNGSAMDDGILQGIFGTFIEIVQP